MKADKRYSVLLEKVTLAEARKRIEEFRHVKPVDAKSGTTPAPPHDAKGSAPKRKR